jgi:AcrR family transcriptional regulator
MIRDRKSEIVTAARKCFAEFGYDKTTLDDIAREVGINKASFYYYFKSKEEIFSDVISLEADELIESIKSKVDSIAGCRKKILAWVAESLTYNQTNSVLNRLTMDLLKKFSKELLELKDYARNKGTEYLASIFADYKGKGAVHAAGTHKAARAIQDVIYALKDQAHRDSTSFSKMTTDIVFAVSMMLDGILNKRV